jgi:site-specific DNA recombinase
LQKIPSKNGSIWNAGTIKGILSNCNYIGYVRYSIKEKDRYFEAEGKHEPIISEELYNAAQILIKKNSYTAPTKKPVDPNYFVGFIYCDLCGAKYNTQNAQYKTKKGEAKTVYSFACRMRLAKGDFCKSRQTAATKIENALIDYFARFDEVFTSDSKEAARIEKEQQNTDSQVKKYKDKIRHFENKEKEIMSHYINGDIDFINYRNMKKQIDGDIAFIQSELAKLDVFETDNHPATFTKEEIAASFQESWEGLTNAEKRLFLTNYIKKIVIKSVPIEGSRHEKTIVTRVEFNTF